MNTALQHGRVIADTARELRITGQAPALAELLERMGELVYETGAIVDCDVPRAMDQVRALATSNLHGALADRLGCSPQRTDAQLLEHVARLRARANGDAR